MSRRSKNGNTLGEHAIFGDEEAARLRADLDEVQAALRDLGDRVHSQFTTIAAHAEIARQQFEHVRAEARADLDRTRDTLIKLIEQVRAETSHGGSGGDAAADDDRVDALARQVQLATQQVESCFHRQSELADTMAALIDTVFAEQRGEPVAGLALD